MEPISSRKHLTIVLLIFAVIAAAGYVANVQHGAGAEANRIGLYVSVVVGQLALIRYVKIGLRVPVREIVGGFRWFDVLIAAALFGAIRLLSPFIQRWLQTDDHTAFLQPRGVVEIAMWIVVSMVAGVSEEFVFRGYLQRRLPAGVIAQAIVFGVSHGYQGIRSVLNIALIGLLFGIVARWRRSLAPGMIAHAATDIAAIF